jgi:hypothetical protein
VAGESVFNRSGKNVVYKIGYWRTGAMGYWV